MRFRRQPPVLALAALLGLAGCREAPPPSEPVLRPVRTHLVRIEPRVEERVLAGVARAAAESSLSFRVPGTLISIAVAVGDAVRQGQVLARLDPTDFELQVEEAEAALAQGQAGLRRAEADYARVRALYENQNASKSELDAARAAAESATAQVEAGRKRLEQARQQLAYSVLQAPFAGSIAAVDADVNENVRSGQDVFLLTAPGVEVEVAVPEVLIARVEPELPVDVRFDALPERRFPGAVREVGVAVTGSASTFDVTARLLEGDPRIRSGMAAEVTFRFAGEGDSDRIVVPGVAVGEDRQGRFVFVLEPAGAGEGIARRRPVTLGPPAAGLGGLEILEGLAGGELIATAGVRRLTDGARVRLPDAEP